MARDLGIGVSFSPIPGEETVEDLPQLLARLFGGPKGGAEGVGLRRLPGLNIRGIPPDEILRQFLGIGAPGRRPDIGEVLGPSQPAVVEQPTPPDVVATPAEPAPIVGGPELFAGPISGEERAPAEEPAPGEPTTPEAPSEVPSLQEIFDIVTGPEPGPIPGVQEPGGPTLYSGGGGAEPSDEGMTEDELLDLLFPGGGEGGVQVVD